MQGNGNAAELTAWVLVFLIFLAIAFDVYASFRLGARASISTQLLAIAREHPVLAFGAGLLAGHIFWPQRVP